VVCSLPCCSANHCTCADCFPAQVADVEALCQRNAAMAPRGCDVSSWDYVTEPRNVITTVKQAQPGLSSPSRTVTAVKVAGTRSISPNKAATGPQYSPLGHRLRSRSPSRRPSGDSVPFRYLSDAATEDFERTAGSLDSLRSPGHSVVSEPVRMSQPRRQTVSSVSSQGSLRRQVPLVIFAG
jgi:hypothetical protein